MEGFISGNIDFWRDPHRKECFAAFVVDLCAECYDMANGQTLFMSRATKEKLDSSLFITETPRVEHLEAPLNFERFTEAKTSVNVAKWMGESVTASRLKTEDFSHFSADGGSNAIGSLQEYEVVTRVEEGRTNSIDFTICLAHQNERSAGYASGTANFADNPNEELGDILKKSHEIQERVHRNGGRMDVFKQVQDGKERDPKMGPVPSVVSRWNSKCVLHVYVKYPHRAGFVC